VTYRSPAYQILAPGPRPGSPGTHRPPAPPAEDRRTGGHPV